MSGSGGLFGQPTSSGGGLFGQTSSSSGLFGSSTSSSGFGFGQTSRYLTNDLPQTHVYFVLYRKTSQMHIYHFSIYTLWFFMFYFFFANLDLTYVKKNIKSMKNIIFLFTNAFLLLKFCLSSTKTIKIEVMVGIAWVV